MGKTTQTTELRNVNCYCFAAVGAIPWEYRYYLIITDKKKKATDFMEKECRKRSDETENWTFEKADINSAQKAIIKVLL